MFFVAVVAATALARLLDRMSGWRRHGVAILLLLAILFEYRLTPYSFLTVSASDRALYTALSKVQSIHVLVDLPIANDLPFDSPASRGRGQDGIYLYYTLLHHKEILNVLGEIIPSDYFDRTRLLSVNFPTPEKLTLLRTWGIDAIVIHKDEFADPTAYDRMRQQLTGAGLRELLTDGNVSVFPLYP